MDIINVFIYNIFLFTLNLKIHITCQYGFIYHFNMEVENDKYN